MRPRLYLAGPDVFRPDAAAEGERLKRLCREAGLEGLYPLDGQGDDIRRNCIDMIAQADGLVANISPFRGHHMDPGTAFEIGYAQALGKPVFTWSSERRPLAERIPAAAPGRDGDGHLIEDFGKPENLMIVPDGHVVWAGPDEAIHEAARALSFGIRNRALQRQVRRSVLVAAAVSLALALAAGVVANRLIGW
ncbi:nucleoside 2-deoxyribosyltransferase [Ancylobacter amanitiformis]|uniref:Nucleoside 2-deoxyribosyltransferase n=1 Tax=Ancylobacter amanitiformis TaxID=217069 RepID=A0ABU0LPY2_9HYPH|nr:nucleoside 2-deoxyribosyltransferase [Ancylobacter amanitiformis]MDQ0510752.1 nucleoside 2-deoxyribosyltransferase [Ancylobacter amanitiformis]